MKIGEGRITAKKMTFTMQSQKSDLPITIFHNNEAVFELQIIRVKTSLSVTVRKHTCFLLHEREREVSHPQKRLD